MASIINLLQEAYPNLDIIADTNWFGDPLIQFVRLPEDMNHKVWGFRVNDVGPTIIMDGSTEMPGSVHCAHENPLDFRDPEFFEKLNRILSFYLCPPFGVGVPDSNWMST